MEFDYTKFGIGLVIGIVIGVVLGAFNGNLGSGIAIGVAVGGAIGAAMCFGGSDNRNGPDDPQRGDDDV